MKFRFLLWVLGLLMGKASRNNPAFQQQLGDKELVFQLQTLDGGGGGGQGCSAFFLFSLSFVKDQRVTSRSGFYPEPAFAIAFKDAAYGFATLQAKNKQLAFMTGIQDKSIQIKGNPALVIWFQGLTKYLKPKKAKPKA
ncbi:helicase [Pseudomonas protegens]|uniref:helicase n=1 Tax=Pseudomonas protegens TaxID=380021 RepID=UPI002A3651A4|nr:helicase [Pseudomonas protegens]MDX9683347.1 helicase [Pseudomonas protegens]